MLWTPTKSKQCLNLSKEERFAKHVHKIIQGVNFLHHNVSYNNNVSDVVVLDTTMLGLGMVCIILSNMNNTLAIRKHNSNTTLNNKTSKASGFLHALSSSNIFSFCSWKSYHRLKWCFSRYSTHRKSKI